MVAVLLALGLGMVLVSVMGDGDSDDAGESGGHTETLELGAQDDLVNDVSNRDTFEANLLDLVAEGEISAAAADEARDAVTFVESPARVAMGDGDDLFSGTDGNFADTVWGDDGDDEINGAGGDDDLYGGPGNDTLHGGDGSDQLFGSIGADWLLAVDEDQQSSDTVKGGWGADYIEVDEGDVVQTGASADTVEIEVYSGVAEGFRVVTIEDFDPAEDVLWIEGDESTIYPDGYVDGDFSNPAITVADMEDGTGAIVSIGGVPVAHVFGGQGMTAADVRLSA